MIVSTSRSYRICRSCCPLSCTTLWTPSNLAALGHLIVPASRSYRIYRSCCPLSCTTLWTPSNLAALWWASSLAALWRASLWWASPRVRCTKRSPKKFPSCCHGRLVTRLCSSLQSLLPPSPGRRAFPYDETSRFTVV